MTMLSERAEAGETALKRMSSAPHASSVMASRKRTGGERRARAMWLLSRNACAWNTKCGRHCSGRKDVWQAEMSGGLEHEKREPFVTSQRAWGTNDAKGMAGESRIGDNGWGN